MSAPDDFLLDVTSDNLLTRIHDPESAALRFPGVFGRLAPALARSDPAADEVIREFNDKSPEQLHAQVHRVCEGASDVSPALARLVQESAQLEQDVDEARLSRAGRLFFRAGVLGGLTLGTRSLVRGYASPVGNKPLAFTGALENKAERRLAETSSFVTAVCTAGQLHPPSEGRPAGDGFRLALHVRLMHAKVRAMAWNDTRWQRTKWGLPINQHDMLATVLLFSVVFVDGLKHLGLSITKEEADDYQYLWNHVGRLLGVESKLLPRDAREASLLSDFVRETQGPPDADSRALVEALLSAPLRQAKTPAELRIAHAHTQFARHMCRAMLDKETALGLGLGSETEAPFIRRLRRVMRLLEKMRVRVPPLDEMVRLMGAKYWTWNSQGADDQSGGFVSPATLEGAPR